MVRNDTRHSDPITLRWAFDVGAKEVSRGDEQLTIAPGHGKRLTLDLAVPPVAGRAEATLELACIRNGRTLWSERKSMTVLNPDARGNAVGPLASLLGNGRSSRHATAEHGSAVSSREQPRGPAPDCRVLIVGPNVVTPRLSTDPRWLALADGGKRIIVLEQEASAPLPGHRRGSRAHQLHRPHGVHAGTHASGLRRLEPDDFVFWPGGHIVYRNIYRKATRGARSLLHATNSLVYCALAECAVGEGLLLLCQAVVGQQLESSPVAARLFDGLVDRALTYRRMRNATVVCLPESGSAVRPAQDSGLVFTLQSDPVAALRDGRSGVVVADAAPAHLAALASAPDVVNTFGARGGTLMVWGLTPEGLPAFNRLVGVQHCCGRSEGKGRDCRAACGVGCGLSQSDVALSQRQTHRELAIHRVGCGRHVQPCVDLDDIVPFLKGPGIEPDSNGGSIANGFTDADSGGTSATCRRRGRQGRCWNMNCRAPKTSSASRLCPTAITESAAVRPHAQWQPGGGRHAEPRTVLARGQSAPGFRARPQRREKLHAGFHPVGRARTPTIGIDNLWIKVRRPADFRAKVQPLVDNGGLVF